MSSKFVMKMIKEKILSQ